MKIAYIAHPISGDVRGNLRRIAAIGRKINLEEPEVVPFANYFFECYALEDGILEERERGVKNNIALMRKGFIDEIRLYGNRISKGMSREVDLALELGIEVIPMTEATKRGYQEIKLRKLKKEINELLLKMQAGENCIGDTADKLLNLYDEDCFKKVWELKYLEEAINAVRGENVSSK